MVRISKQNRKRNVSPRRPRQPGVKTGTKKDDLPEGFRVHPNAVEGNLAQNLFIPKVK